MSKKLSRNKKSGRVPRKSVWKDVSSRNKPAKELPKEEPAQKPIVEETANPADLFGDTPMNQLHKMLFFDNPLGRSYIEKLMGSLTAYSRISKPETLTIDELTSIAGFLKVNPVWLFCRLLADYSNLLAKEAQSPDAATMRYKRAYLLRRTSEHFRESQGLHLDAQTALSVIDELFPSSRGVQGMDY